MKYDCSFQDKCFTESDFRSCLKREKDLEKAYCRLCMKNFLVPKHGVKTLHMHASSSELKSRR